ncbi:uncharacterized protein LOC134412130 [Elgaria multicarinata webbii]|uniref:uncharacterized protein LOC134412093 n=1 Tax=Elgaria multicarinata webbii TaxID=159646 RepID=UPI002FCCD95F
MGSSAPITFLSFLFLLQAASAVDPNKNFARMVGSFVDFPIMNSKEDNYTNFILRSKTQGLALALWQPDKYLSIIIPRYSGRIALQKSSNTIRIHNLTLRDGGTYEIEAQIVAKPVQIKTYTLFVFNISTTVEQLTNNSCNVNLLCDARTGTPTQVTYSWKQKESGVTLSQNSRLHVVLNPGEKTVYTCAVEAHRIQSALDFAPYKFCSKPHSETAGGGAPGLPSLYLMAKAILVPAAVALLVML